MTLPLRILAFPFFLLAMAAAKSLLFAGAKLDRLASALRDWIWGGIGQ